MDRLKNQERKERIMVERQVNFQIFRNDEKSKTLGTTNRGATYTIALTFWLCCFQKGEKEKGMRFFQPDNDDF